MDKDKAEEELLVEELAEAADAAVAEEPDLAEVVFAPPVERRFLMKEEFLVIRKSALNAAPPWSVDKSELELIILYDNNPGDPQFQTDWGFSCFVSGLEKTILFDTGTNGKILISNMEKAGISPGELQVVVLSHFHRDHTGGLGALLTINSQLEVWLPGFFPQDFKHGIWAKGGRVKEVTSAEKIFSNAYTTGVVIGWIREQSLVLDTGEGLVLITGCAHSRIVKILERVKEQFRKDIYLAMGGFHLAGFEKNEIREILGRFREFGVKKTAPSHCTGGEARALFEEEYGDDFFALGVGKRLKIP
ncbi:MAG: MBL fold metallo-hydrolase [Acidobacteriota bacterium]